MKTLVRISAVAVIALFGLAACKQGVFDPQAIGDAETLQEFISSINTSVGSADAAATPMTATVATGTVTNTTSEVVQIDFTNGVVDVSDGTVAGLTVYKLNAGTAGEPYERNDSVTYTADVIPDGAGNSSLYLSMDLSGTDISTPIEIVLDAATLRGNSGARKLNMDGDNVAGESPDDTIFDTVAVTGALVTANGIPRDPEGLSGYGTPGAINDGDTTIEIDFSASANTVLTNLTAESLAAGISVVRIESGSDSAVSTTPSYDSGTGILTLTLDSAAASGQVYQIIYDEYNITTDSAVGGITQRANTDQTADPVRSNAIVVGGGGFAFSLDTGGPPPQTDDLGVDPVRVEVVFTGGVGDVNTDTLTQENVRFFIANADGDLVAVKWSSFVRTDGTDGANVFTFTFPASFDPPASAAWQLYLSPAITEDYATTDTTDDIHLVDTTGAGAARRGYSFASGTLP